MKILKKEIKIGDSVQWKFYSSMGAICEEYVRVGDFNSNGDIYLGQEIGYIGRAQVTKHRKKREKVDPKQIISSIDAEMREENKKLKCEIQIEEILKENVRLKEELCALNNIKKEKPILTLVDNDKKWELTVDDYNIKITNGINRTIDPCNGFPVNIHTGKRYVEIRGWINCKSNEDIDE